MFSYFCDQVSRVKAATGYLMEATQLLEIMSRSDLHERTLPAAVTRTMELLEQSLKNEISRREGELLDLLAEVKQLITPEIAEECSQKTKRAMTVDEMNARLVDTPIGVTCFLVYATTGGAWIWWADELALRDRYRYMFDHLVWLNPHSNISWEVETKDKVIGYHDTLPNANAQMKLNPEARLVKVVEKKVIDTKVCRLDPLYNREYR